MNLCQIILFAYPKQSLQKTEADMQRYSISASFPDLRVQIHIFFHIGRSGRVTFHCCPLGIMCNN